MRFNWPLIGHDHIKTHFEKAFRAGNISHAYLFKGPAQVGKATFAKMLAKTMLGEEVNNHPDLVILDRGEEAHISIEAARKFIQDMSTKPLLGKRKVGIIEEASEMTIPAANALLKTIEEPCDNVTIFLIAERPVLPTISSRCQAISFGFVPENEIKKLFPEKVAKFCRGRPGRAMAEPEAINDHEDLLKEVVDVLANNEGNKLMWAQEQFKKIKSLPEKRAALKGMLELMEIVLRDQMKSNFSKTICSMLKRLAQGRTLLEANVDPKIICEYILLN